VIYYHLFNCQALDKAQAEYDAALLAADLAAVSVLASDDWQLPPPPFYDVEDDAKKMMQRVDRKYITSWMQDIPQDGDADLPPIGLKEAKLEEAATER
jgi:hypothetical protein